MPCGCASTASTLDAPQAVTSGSNSGGIGTGVFCPRCFWFWIGVAIIVLLVIGARKERT